MAKISTLTSNMEARDAATSVGTDLTSADACPSALSPELRRVLSSVGVSGMVEDSGELRSLYNGRSQLSPKGSQLLPYSKCDAVRQEVRFIMPAGSVGGQMLLISIQRPPEQIELIVPAGAVPCDTIAATTMVGPALHVAAQRAFPGCGMVVLSHLPAGNACHGPLELM